MNNKEKANHRGAEKGGVKLSFIWVFPYNKAQKNSRCFILVPRYNSLLFWWRQKNEMTFRQNYLAFVVYKPLEPVHRSRTFQVFVFTQPALLAVCDFVNGEKNFSLRPQNRRAPATRASIHQIISCPIVWNVWWSRGVKRKEVISLIIFWLEYFQITANGVSNSWTIYVTWLDILFLS